MRIAVLRERRSGERRVAISPEMGKKYRALNVEVAVEQGAGLGASFTDAEFEAAGARIAASPAEALEGADLLLKVQRPVAPGDDEAMAGGDGGGGDEMALLRSGLVLVGVLNPVQHRDQVQAYAQAGVNAFAMEFMPRITRAQSMDVLSSQSNLAGYRAVLDASAEFGRAFPMMMTAAGTVAPAKVFVMGAGVAGLQAIATARRLGAIVSATDVRPATKEQVEAENWRLVVELTTVGLGRPRCEPHGTHHAMLRERRAVARMHLSQPNAAMEDVDAAVALAPRFVAARMLRAKLLTAIGRNEAAFLDYRAVHAAAPHTGDEQDLPHGFQKFHSVLPSGDNFATDF